MLRILRNKYII